MLPFAGWSPSRAKDVPGDKRLVAYVVANEPPADLFEQLRAMLREAVPDYMVPAHFVTLDALPLTPNGKVDRKALPAPQDRDAGSRADTYVAPRNELEIGLAAAWQNVLGVARVGIHDSFFDLGGNSLALVKLMLEMEKLTGIEITLGTIFRCPTIAGLVETFGAGTAEEASLIIPLTARREWPGDLLSVRDHALQGIRGQPWPRATGVRRLCGRRARVDQAGPAGTKGGYLDRSAGASLLRGHHQGRAPWAVSIGRSIFWRSRRPAGRIADAR